MKRRIITFLVLIVLILSVSSTASAQEPIEPPTCAGTVVSVDEFGLITVDPDPTVDGDECTVTLTSDYGHPITTLLGSYFSDVNVNTEDLVAALDSTEVCVVQVPNSNPLQWTIEEPAEDEECSGEEVTVTGENPDGTFSAQKDDDTLIDLTVDEETAGDLNNALDNLNVDFDLNDDGSVVEVGDDIGEYHDLGYGFGVLVKVYSIIEGLEASCGEEELDDLNDPPLNETANADDPVDLCETTVADLIARLDGDESMGDLFAIFGKPSMVGVGHVRNAGDGSGGDGKNGVCHARSQGGTASATGQNINCGTTIPNSDKDKSDKDGDGNNGDDD